MLLWACAIVSTSHRLTFRPLQGAQQTLDKLLTRTEPVAVAQAASGRRFSVVAAWRRSNARPQRWQPCLCLQLE
jgi:hypothetical protein